MPCTYRGAIRQFSGSVDFGSDYLFSCLCVVDACMVSGLLVSMCGCSRESRDFENETWSTDVRKLSSRGADDCRVVVAVVAQN